MSPRTKSVLLLAGTLVLGVLLGAAGTGLLARERQRRVGELRGPRGFVAHMEEVIRPRDERQRAAIEPILEATGTRNDTIIRHAHGALRAQLDSMRLRLAPLLDAEQRRRLEAVGRLPDPFRPPPPPPR